MSRILLCWEMGLNHGHVVPLSRLATQFEARGHDVFYCLKEPASARPFLGTEVSIYQAPLPTEQYCRNEPLHNYTDILRRHGYVHTAVIENLLTQWFSVFDDVQPDLIIGDHSPTALLAARCRNIPTAAIGNGFTVPPLQSPMPLARWWLPTPPRVELRRAEREVLNTINTVLKGLKVEPLKRVADVLDANVRGLLTVRELDEYPERVENEHYFGFQTHTGDGAWPGWPNNHAPRVLGYLRGAYDSLKPILLALNNSPASALVYVPDVQMNGPVLKVSERVTLSSKPLDVHRGAEECDAAVSYASTGFVADILAQGKPLLLAPRFTQQAMLAQRVMEAGAGLLGQPGWTRDDYLPVVNELITSHSLSNGAQTLARAISAYPRGEQVSQRLVDACEQWL